MSPVCVVGSLARIGLLACFAIGSGLTAFADEQFRSLASLPRDSSPAPVLLQGQDGNLYGVLSFTEINHEGETNGLVYQLSTTGSFRVLHRFDWPRDGGPNAGGAEPSPYLVMGKDGFLYGMTNFGGAYGTGVLYRLGTNGDYAVLAHLNPYLPGYRMRGLVLGPDDAAYTYDWDNGLVRIGFDGSEHVVSAEPKQFVSIKPFGEDGSKVVLTWTKHGRSTIAPPVPPTLHMRILELPSLNVVESQDIAYFPIEEYEAGIVSVREDDLLVLSPSQNYNPVVPGRLMSFDRAGNATLIAEVGASTTGGTFLPAITQMLVATDGSLFFTSGQQTKGDIALYGGTEIYWLKRNGGFKKIADLDGWPLAAWCEGAKGNNVYGVSWGPVVLEPSDVTATAVREAGAGSRVVARATRSKNRVRRAAFRFQTDPTTGNFLPIARPDRYVLPSNGKPIALPVLRNDRDLEMQALAISEIGTPKNGTATIVPGTGSKPATLSYAPLEGRPLSDVFTYTISDSAGGVAVGQVSIRGALKGNFRGTALWQSPDDGGAAVSLDRMGIVVAAGGQLTGSIVLNGKRVGLTGKFATDNIARVHRRIKGTSDVVFSELTLANVSGARVLRYKITYLGRTIEGTLPQS